MTFYFCSLKWIKWNAFLGRKTFCENSTQGSSVTWCSVISPVLVAKHLKGNAAFVNEFFLISLVVHLHISVEYFSIHRWSILCVGIMPITCVPERAGVLQGAKLQCELRPRVAWVGSACSRGPPALFLVPMCLAIFHLMFITFKQLISSWERFKVQITAIFLPPLDIIIYFQKRFVG